MGFRYDPIRREVSIDGRSRTLRPKAASLLAALLEARGQLVMKRDLVRRVWRSEHVQDQTLFQTVSELRRCLAPLDAIRTHPNLGYEWVGPNPEPVRRHRAIAAGIAALALAAGAAAALQGVYREEAVIVDTTMRGGPVLSPALRAFSLGVGHRQARRMDQATRYFQLAVRENPEFLEARLMLSEALLAQGRPDAAREAAQSVVMASENGNDGYALVTALGLLSRTDETLGDAAGALAWALSAAERATALGFACAAADMKARADTLARPEAEASRLVAPGRLSDHTRGEPSVRLSRLEPPTKDDEVPEYCSDMAPGDLDTGALVDPGQAPSASAGMPCGVASNVTIRRV